MKIINNEIPQEKLFCYNVDDDIYSGCGIIVAETLEEAHKKVKAAYTSIGMPDINSVSVWKHNENQDLSEYPDIMEL